MTCDVISSAAADLRRFALAFADGGRGVEAAARFRGGALTTRACSCTLFVMT